MAHFLFVEGHTVLEVNGRAVRGCLFDSDGRDVQEYLADSSNYPIALKFGRPKLTTNDKIMVASMFHS